MGVTKTPLLTEGFSQLQGSLYNRRLVSLLFFVMHSLSVTEEVKSREGYILRL